MKSDIIIKIINEYDPVGLLKMGAPEDEYIYEAEEIVRLFQKNISLNDFQTEVRKIFIESFGIKPKCDLLNLNQMASEIYLSVNKL